MLRVRNYVAVLVFMGVIGAGPILAQSERGTITGTVHDSSGAVVPAANVRITNVATNVTIATTSNLSGEFHGARAGHRKVRPARGEGWISSVPAHRHYGGRR